MEPMLTEIAVNVLKKRYLIKNEAGEVVETPQQMFERVARFVASADAQYGRDPVEFTEIAFEMMTRRDFLPNTPCLANAGRENGTGQLSACFVLPIDDSMVGIMETLKHAALIHQSGGGTGFSFSKLRPEGDFVRSTTGVASGPISFMEMYNHATECVKQSGMRRGANMGILRVDHPDILKFIDCKQNTAKITNFNISIGITQKFMDALMRGGEYDLINPRTGICVGTLSAEEVWNKGVKNAWLTGEPGLFFIDRVNDLDPLSDVMGAIEATNPCVTGDTLVLTRQGMKRIGELVGRKIDVWNGEEWSSVEPRITGENQPVVRVELSNGLGLTCTPYHTFYLADGTKLRAEELQPGDPLEKLGFSPPTTGGVSFEAAYLAGFYQGDGYYNTEKRQQEINFYGEDKLAVAQGLVDVSQIKLQPYCEPQDRQRGVLQVEVPEKGDVPLNWNTSSSLEFLAGLLDSDGTLAFSDKTHRSYAYQISSVSREFLVQVLYLLRQLGVPAHLGLMKQAERKAMPGGEYDCQPCWRITISATGVVRLFEHGLRPRRLYTGPNKPNRHPGRFPRVVSVVPVGRAEKVYCFTEPKRHRGVFSSIITGQCGEVPLRAYDACTLGSINLGNFVDNGQVDYVALENTVLHAIHFLDNVISVNKYPVKQIYDVTLASRKVGLGVMGWADMLIKLGIRYDSQPALVLAERIQKFINNSAVYASVELAKERGPFPAWEKSRWCREGLAPRRNSTVTVIAPTGTISIIAGCSSGIEPLFALSMVRNQAGLKMVDTNPAFVEVVKQCLNGSAENALLQVAETGSCQAVEDLPPSIKDLYKTAGDIDPEWHVRMQAAFQRHVEDAVSKTINLPQNATVEDVQRAYRLAWQLGCKGITVYRDGSRPEQVLSVKGPVAAPEGKKWGWRRIPETNGERAGKTITKDTAFGSLHTTINRHPTDGQPFECFGALGKGGAEVTAFAAALGRASSLLLQIPSELSPMERLGMLAKQLKGLSGTQHGIGEQRVESVPDALAQAILQFLVGENGEQVEVSTARDICPDCRKDTLFKGGKCDVCTHCGFAKC